MIRQMLRLAVDAARVEIDIRRNPPPALAEPAQPTTTATIAELAPVVDRDVKPAKDNRWESPTFHVETLRSETCPDCGEPKKVGSYRCAPCTKVAVAAREAAWDKVEEVSHVA